MYRMAPTIVSAALILLCTCGTSALAQDRPAEKFRERIETLTMWRMMQALDLDDEAAEKILEIRRKYLAKRKGLRTSLAEDFRKLRAYLDDSEKKTDDKKLATIIEGIRTKRKEFQSLREQQFDDVAKVLPVRKQAELVLFMKDFRKEIRSMIRDSMPHRDRRFRQDFDGTRGQGRPGLRPRMRTGTAGQTPPGPPARWNAPDKPAYVPGE